MSSLSEERARVSMSHTNFFMFILKMKMYPQFEKSSVDCACWNLWPHEVQRQGVSLGDLCRNVLLNRSAGVTFVAKNNGASLSAPRQNLLRRTDRHGREFPPFPGSSFRS